MPKNASPNEIIVSGDIATMTLTPRKRGPVVTIFDAEDIPKVRSVYYRWYAFFEKRLNSYYVLAVGQSKYERKSIRLARLVSGCPEGYVPDHINHDTLDNRKVNLRIVPQTINLLNKNGAYKSSASGIRGVHFHKATQKWCAAVQLNGDQQYQLCSTLEEATRVVSEMRERIHGPLLRVEAGEKVLARA